MIRFTILLIVGLTLTQFASTSDVKSTNTESLSDSALAAIQEEVSQNDIINEIASAFENNRPISKELIENYNSTAVE